MINRQELIEIEKELGNQLNAHVASGIRNQISRGHNNASDIGFPCDTYQAACRLKGKLRPKIDISLEKIFRVGREWEQPNVRWLQDAQIQVRQTGDKRFEWEKYNIVGYMEADLDICVKEKKEAWLRMLDQAREKAAQTAKEEEIWAAQEEIDKIRRAYPGIKIPLEHKTVSPNGFRSIKYHKEKGIPLTQAKQSWVKKYPGQLMTYMLFKEVEIGAWFYFEKTSGDFLWWLTLLDYEYAETLLKRAERCEENVKNNFIPEPVATEDCNYCDFALTYCFPDKDYGPGFVFLSDQEAADYLDERDVLIEPHKKFTPLDKLIKDHFRGQNVVIKGKRGTYKIETKGGAKRTMVTIEKQ